MKSILVSGIARAAMLLFASLAFATSCASKQKQEPPKDATTQAEDRAVKANDALAEEAKRHEAEAEAVGKRAENFWGRLEKSWDKRF